MVATLPFGYVKTTNAANTFTVTSNGGMQGTFMADPAARFALAGGLVSQTATRPMWGGMGITEDIPYPFGTSGGPYPAAPLGGNIVEATATTNLTGFTVFDQAWNMVNSPVSTVPLAGSGMSVNFFRLGSGARLWVACDPGLASLEGGAINQNVSWDFNDQMLQEYVASGGTESVTSMTWSSTNGGQVAVVMGSASIYKLGDTINVGGVTNTGTGAVSLINTNQVINTWTDSTHFTFLLPGTSTLWGTFAGTIVLNVGTGALAVKVLRFELINSMTVNYASATGFATWNYNGSCALILI